MSNRPSLSYLADLGSKLALPKIKESLRNLSTGKLTGGYLQSLANTLNARADSWKGASKNIRQAIEALEVAENALNEIAALSTRLEELGALYNNNSLLSTSDIASLNAETASITSSIDGIVSGTTYNGVNMLGTSKVTLDVGVTDNGGMQSLTTGTVSSVASTTEASNADTTGLAVTNQITLNLGEISGGITSLAARENIAYAASAIMSSAATNATDVDIASETAMLTKKMMLQKISASLVAQANLIENAKLSSLS